ncbi:MAG: multicopper oxidase family protein, partial [Nocardioidaceae bacterium]
MTALLVVPLGWMWWASLMPDRYSVMEMGYVDLGGGADLAPAGGHAHGAHGAAAGTVDIATLVADPAREPDVRLELTARRE